MGKPAHFRLDDVTDREHSLRKLGLRKLTQEIALVLIRISTCKYPVYMIAVLVFQRLSVGVKRNFLSAIMACRNHIRTEFFRTFQKSVKLYFPVAQNVRIWSTSFRIFFKHIIHNSLPVLFAEVHKIKRYTDLACNHFSHKPVFLPFTIPVQSGRSIVPILHKKSKDIISLLLQKQSGNT